MATEDISGLLDSVSLLSEQLREMRDSEKFIGHDVIAPAYAASIGTPHFDSNARLFYINYGGGAAQWQVIGGLNGVFGTGVANQVTYWSAANTVAGRATFTDDGTTVYINRNSATALHVEQGGVHDDTLIGDTTNGYVGVNVVPTCALDVVGQTARVAQFGGQQFPNIAIITNNVTSGIADVLLLGYRSVDGEVGTIKGYNRRSSDVNPIADIQFLRDGADDAGAIILQTQPTGGAITERVRVQSDGDVGFGVTPNHKFHIEDGGSSIVQKFGVSSGNSATILSRGTGSSGNYRDMLIVANEIDLKVATTSEGAATKSGVFIENATARVGINNVTAPAAQLHVDQLSTTAAIPVLTLDQADLSEEFIEFITTVGAGNPIDTAAVGTYYGKVRVNVSGVGYKYIALYNT